MMPNSPRLDLSDFRQKGAQPSKGLLRRPAVSDEEDAPAANPTASPVPTETAHKEPKPVFIPVGFHASHLRSLAKAVFELKQDGFLKASKSALIRILVENHLDAAIQLYAAQNQEK